MSGAERIEIQWVIITLGGRPDSLSRAAKSLSKQATPVVVVSNGGGVTDVIGLDVDVVDAERNLGVPGGRDLGARTCAASIIGFLDDDAELHGDAQRVVAAFDADDQLGAVALRLVDDDHETARRHVPRPGRRGAERSGDVALFLGGACAIRREAYLDAGGYFTELFYGHEELELSWRLIDRGWTIRYLADVHVFHPRTEIGRHPDGWRLTGRNRVWIARRTLPWPVAIVHAVAWLALGALRAPRGDCRRSYVRGWLHGWRHGVEHRPIRWRTVWRLTRLGRPPVI